MLPSMDGLAQQLAACSFVPPARILLPEGRRLDLFMESTQMEGCSSLEGTGFLRAVPEQDELKVQVCTPDLFATLV